ncbi:MAG: lytic transglycosylase domain-containing protein [Armatimonas sp.]
MPATWAQTPLSQYLKLKKQTHPDPTLDPAEVKANPRAYASKTFEFKGIFRGSVGDEDSDEGVLLIIDGVPSLRMSRVPDWLGKNVEVRLLCVASPVPDDELRTGWPDFSLVAIIESSEIDALEARQRAAEAARIAAAKKAAQQKELVTPVKQAQNGSSSAPNGPRPPRFRSPHNASTAPPAGPPIRLTELTEEAQGVFPVYRDYIRNHNRRLNEQQAGSITYAILKFSQEWDMDPRLIVATIIAESDFRIQERSHAGAMGLIQLMPDEVQRLKLSNPYDPIQNVMGGIFLLKERLNKYSGSSNFKDASMQHIILALASYNAGMGAVKKYGGVPPYRETQGYVRRIEKLYRELCAGDAAPNP